MKFEITFWSFTRTAPHQYLRIELLVDDVPRTYEIKPTKTAFGEMWLMVDLKAVTDNVAGQKFLREFKKYALARDWTADPQDENYGYRVIKFINYIERCISDIESCEGLNDALRPSKIQDLKCDKMEKSSKYNISFTVHESSSVNTYRVDTRVVPTSDGATDLKVWVLLDETDSIVDADHVRLLMNHFLEHGYRDLKNVLDKFTSFSVLETVKHLNRIINDSKEYT